MLRAICYLSLSLFVYFVKTLFEVNVRTFLSQVVSVCVHGCFSVQNYLVMCFVEFCFHFSLHDI